MALSEAAGGHDLTGQKTRGEICEVHRIAGLQESVYSRLFEYILVSPGLPIHSTIRFTWCELLMANFQLPKVFG